MFSQSGSLSLIGNGPNGSVSHVVKLGPESSRVQTQTKIMKKHKRKGSRSHKALTIAEHASHPLGTENIIQRTEKKCRRGCGKIRMLVHYRRKCKMMPLWKTVW